MHNSQHQEQQQEDQELIHQISQYLLQEDQRQKNEKDHSHQTTKPIPNPNPTTTPTQYQSQQQSPPPINMTSFQSSDDNNRQLEILSHKKTSNLKLQTLQIKQILQYNQFMMVEMEKVQTKRSIRQLQIQIRKLKIQLRNGTYTKGINYTFPIKKHNDDFRAVEGPSERVFITEQIRDQYRSLEQELKRQGQEREGLTRKCQLLQEYRKMLIQKNKDKIQSTASSSSGNRSSSSSRIGKGQKSNNKNPPQKQMYRKQSQSNSTNNNYQVLMLKKQSIEESLLQFKEYCHQKEHRIQQEINILKNQLEMINQKISESNKELKQWQEMVEEVKCKEKRRKKLLNDNASGYWSQKNLINYGKGKTNNCGDSFQRNLRGNIANDYGGYMYGYSRSPSFRSNEKFLVTFNRPNQGTEKAEDHQKNNNSKKNFIEKNKNLAKVMQRRKDISNRSKSRKEASSSKDMTEHGVKQKNQLSSRFLKNTHRQSDNQLPGKYRGSSNSKKITTIQTKESLEKMACSPSCEYFTEPF